MWVDIYTDSQGFQVLRNEWNMLVKRSMTDTIFLTHEWQSVWWEHLGEGDLFVIAVRDDAGTLVGIGPLYRVTNQKGQRVLEVVGCVDVSDYLDFIIEDGQSEAVYQTVLDILDGGEIAWDVVSLCNIPGASPTHRQLATLASERGYRVAVEVEDVCPIIPLPESWEAYLEMLEGKDRRELRRKMRRADRTVRVAWHLARRSDEVDSGLDLFFDLHQKSHPDKAAFMDERMQAFFRAMSRTVAGRDWLELALLHFDSIPVAATLAFDYNDEILLYNSGYEAEGYYASLSPGWVLTALHIGNAIERGKRAFNFLRGNEDYKYRFGAKDTRVYRLTIERNGR